MSDYDHKADPEQTVGGGYICATCSEDVVLVLGTNTWFHKDEAPTMQNFPGERRSPIKTFTRVSDDLTVQQYKNRREALYCAVYADLYNDEEEITKAAEKYERWLNRPDGEWWHKEAGDEHFNGPSVLRAVEDVVPNV